RGRVHAGGGHHDAAVDDVEVRHVVAPSFGVDYRGGRIAPHARGAHEVPAAGAQERIGGDLAGAGRVQDLTGARDAVVEHAPAVLAEPVRDPRSGNAVPVGQRGIEVDAIVRLRKILADDRDGDGAVEALAVGTPVLAAPGHAVTDRAAVGRGDRREPTRNLERVA